MADWHDEARKVPLFDGAAISANGAKGRVTTRSATDRRFWWIRWDGDEADGYFHDRVRQEAGSALIPDLTDPMTANEALRRLALAMGAPEEAVEEGVMFRYDEDNEEWDLFAGPELVWCHLAQGITDRPAAIARAWKETSE